MGDGCDVVAAWSVMEGSMGVEGGGWGDSLGNLRDEVRWEERRRLEAPKETVAEILGGGGGGGGDVVESS